MIYSVELQVLCARGWDTKLDHYLYTSCFECADWSPSDLIISGFRERQSSEMFSGICLLWDMFVCFKEDFQLYEKANCRKSYNLSARNPLH